MDKCQIPDCCREEMMRVLYTLTDDPSQTRDEIRVCSQHYSEFLVLKKRREVFIINNTYTGDGHY